MENKIIERAYFPRNQTVFCKERGGHISPRVLQPGDIVETFDVTDVESAEVKGYKVLQATDTDKSIRGMNGGANWYSVYKVEVLPDDD